LPYATPLKAGAVSWPFFGITPKIVNEKGETVPHGTMGKLVIATPWPGMMKTIYKNPKRFDSYFSQFPGNYAAGDDAVCDKENDFWIKGRNDDVIKVSGHRLGSAEIENALLTDDIVAEAAVVGVPHDIKGEAIYAFITLKSAVKPTEAYKQQLIAAVREHIGAIAAPDQIQWASALPKTRSGKIMRRLLRKIAKGEFKELGDVSTLDNPLIVTDIINERKKSL
jgi:acetyl-CoA synthetase